MTARRRIVLAVALSVLLVASAATAGVSASSHQGAGTPAADDAYVTDDGDVVLVYEQPRDDGEADVQFGADVSENLAYALLTQPVDEEPDVRWSVDAVAEPDSVDADGSLSMPQGDAIESLDLSVTGESTDEVSRSDFDLSATLAGGGVLSLVQSATTEGEVTMGPDRFYATGSIEAASPMISGESTHESVALRETDAGYELSVEQRRPLDATAAERWQNESVARETIREQYVPVANASDVEATGNVSIESLSVTETEAGQHRLETAFTVDYENVDETVRQLIVTSAAQQSEVDQAAAERLADELVAAEVTELRYSTTTEQGSTQGNFTVDVRDYEDLAIAYFDVAESMQPQAGSTDSFEQARSQFEAQQAAGLEQRYTWDGQLSNGADGTTVEFTLDYRTENWQAYVDELESRDLPHYDSSFTMNGSTDGERLAFDGSLSMSGEDLFAQFGEQFQGGMATGPTTPGWMASLAEAQPRTARLSGSYDADGLRLEAGASFGDLAALRDTLATDYDLPAASSVVGRTEGDAGVTYARVPGAVSGDASETDVRALAGVDDSTAVHLPGDWDRDFPSMDAEQARNFVEDTSASGGSGPGFGPAVAVVALLAATFLALRRR